MTRYINLDDEGLIVGIGSTTDPASLELVRQHHKGNVETIPDDMVVEHGAKYDRATKTVVEKPRPRELPKIVLTPEQERHAAMPPIEEFAEAYYQERRGNPAPMEVYLKKRDEVDRKFARVE